MSADKMPPLPGKTPIHASHCHQGAYVAFGYEAADMHAYARTHAAEQVRELVSLLRIVADDLDDDNAEPWLIELVAETLAKHKGQA